MAHPRNQPIIRTCWIFVDMSLPQDVLRILGEWGAGDLNGSHELKHTRPEGHKIRAVTLCVVTARILEPILALSVAA